jgi:hypothetical protein
MITISQLISCIQMVKMSSLALTTLDKIYDINWLLTFTVIQLSCVHCDSN